MERMRQFSRALQYIDTHIIRDKTTRTQNKPEMNDKCWEHHRTYRRSVYTAANDIWGKLFPESYFNKMALMFRDCHWLNYYVLATITQQPCKSPERGVKPYRHWGRMGWMLADHRDGLSSSSFTMILDSSVGLSAGIQSAEHSIQRTLGSRPAFRSRRKLVFFRFDIPSLLPVHQKLTPTNMYIAKARGEAISALGSSGLNAR